MPFEFIGPARLYIGNPTIAAGAGMKDLGDVEDITFDPGVRVSFTSSAALSGAPKAGGIHFLTPLPVVQAQLKDAATAIIQEMILNGKLLGAAGTSANITGVNQGTKTFTVAADVTSTHTAGTQLAVEGSTGNDGIYTVVSSTYTTSTAIVVKESIPDDTVDGTIGVATSIALGGGDELTLVAEANVPTLAIVPHLQLSDGVDAANAIWLPAAVPDQLSGLTFNRPQAGEIGNPYNAQFMGAYRSADQASTGIAEGNRMWFMGPPDDLSLTWYLPS